MAYNALESFFAPSRMIDGSCLGGVAGCGGYSGKQSARALFDPSEWLTYNTGIASQMQAEALLHTSMDEPEKRENKTPLKKALQKEVDEWLSGVFL